MLAKKFISAYFLSAGLVLYLTLITSGGITSDPNAPFHFVSMATAVSIYVFPLLFVYGVGVSILIDWLLFKLRARGLPNILLAALLHIGMGYLAGVLIPLSFLRFYGALSAALFFLVYQLLIRVKLKGSRGRIAAIAALSAPILLFIGLFVNLYSAAPQPEPFTREDAVTFATSGNGSSIELFPKREGTIALTVDGYHIERETKGTVVSVALGKERYTVSFIERWSKDERSGEYRMNYTIGRGSLDYAGSEGEELPYRR